MIKIEITVDDLNELKIAEAKIAGFSNAQIYCFEDGKTRFYEFGKKIDEA